MFSHLRLCGHKLSTCDFKKTFSKICLTSRKEKNSVKAKSINVSTIKDLFKRNYIINSHGLFCQLYTGTEVQKVHGHK